jgi:aerobic carbon-monoxide dehydrogenase medium subunit
LNGQRPSIALIRRAADVARDAVDPPDDIHAESAYRRELIGVLLERVLASAGEFDMPEAA